MADSPIIYGDLGDGKRRRFYLGADELRSIKREGGRGYYSLYRSFAQDADPEEVAAVIRLALIGGGLAPADALDLVDYYCRPPRPLKDAYLLAFQALNAAWNGSEVKSSKAKPMTVEEMDNYFTDLEAALLKSGQDVSVLKGKSFAEIQDLMSALADDKKADAPDAETFNAIKATHKKARKK